MPTEVPGPFTSTQRRQNLMARRRGEPEPWVHPAGWTRAGGGRTRGRADRVRADTPDRPPAAPMPTVAVPTVVPAQTDDEQPVSKIYTLLGDATRPRRAVVKGKQVELPPDVGDIHRLASAFNATASGLQRLQAMVSADELRQVVELVTPHLPEEVADRLGELLQRFDARRGAIRA